MFRSVQNIAGVRTLKCHSFTGSMERSVALPAVASMQDRRGRGKGGIADWEQFWGNKTQHLLTLNSALSQSYGVQRCYCPPKQSFLLFSLFLSEHTKRANKTRKPAQQQLNCPSVPLSLLPSFSSVLLRLSLYSCSGQQRQQRNIRIQTTYLLKYSY